MSRQRQTKEIQKITEDAIELGLQICHFTQHDDEESIEIVDGDYEGGDYSLEHVDGVIISRS